MVNIADVARHAGVSRSTVSYVLSGKRRISTATRERVSKSIIALGFEPNPAARALTTRQTNTVALAVTLNLDAPSIDTAALSDFVMATAYSLRALEYDMLLLAQPAETQIERLRRGLLADGLIVMDVLWEERRLPVLSGSPIPVVLMGDPENSESFGKADLDYIAAGEQAVSHLIALGHRRIAVTSGPEGLSSVVRVERGAQIAAASAPEVRLAMHSSESAETWLMERLSEPDPPTGLVIHNQGHLPGLRDVIDRLALRIPGDLSVIVIGTEGSVRGARPLSIIPVPASAIAEAAVASVLAMTKGGEPQTLFLAPTFVDRGSTKSPFC